jgi:hypothetical protein
MTRRASHNGGLAKVAVEWNADSFVVNKSLVLLINICGKNRHLRQAADLPLYVIALNNYTVDNLSKDK